MLKSNAAYFDAGWERPVVTYNTSATPGELRMKPFLVVPFKQPSMADSVLPKQLPTTTLNLYYHSYTVRQYLLMTWSSIKPLDNNAREVEVTEVGLLNCYQKCTIGISVNQ